MEGGEITNGAERHTSTTCRASYSLQKVVLKLFLPAELVLSKSPGALPTNELTGNGQKRKVSVLLPGFLPWQLAQDKNPGSM